MGRGLELRDDDEPGFWEQYGYHNNGDPRYQATRSEIRPYGRLLRAVWRGCEAGASELIDAITKEALAHAAHHRSSGERRARQRPRPL